MPPTDLTPPISTGSELFLRNMRALWRVDPHLAMRLDAVEDERRRPLERTKSGAWTAKVPRRHAQPVYLHSRYDPVAESEQLIRNADLTDKFCIVVCGLGLGYHVRTLLDRLGESAFVLCIEPSTVTMATALTCTDLAEAIRQRRLMFVLDADKKRLHELLKPVSTLMMLGTEFVRHPPSMAVGDDAYAAVTKSITDFVDFTRMSLMTLVANSRLTCRNIAMNLVHYVTTPPIDVLKDAFAGNPAVIVSAGPSLSRNIDRLVDLNGRAVLIAVQTAMKPLASRGILPDFATTLDFHEISRQFFDGVEGLERVHLVAEPKAAWPVLDEYPGPISVLGNAWAQLVLGDELGVRGSLPAGATVAHLAFYLAVHLGCDPIIFTGQDLAFTGHVFYIPGVEIHRAWRSEINRFHPIEQKEWERIARNRPILRRVTGQDGGELFTDELLFTYLEQFEKDIAGTSRRVINATEGGARIRGTESMTLQEAKGRFARNPIDPARFRVLNSMRGRDVTRLDAAKSAIEQRIRELKEAETVCEELLSLLRELDGLTHDAERFNRRLMRVDELRTRVAQDSRAYRIVNAATQMAELRRFSADRRIDEKNKDEAARAKRQIARDLEFIGAVRDGARDVRPMLLASLERMNAATANRCSR